MLTLLCSCLVVLKTRLSFGDFQGTDGVHQKLYQYIFDKLDKIGSLESKTVTLGPTYCDPSGSPVVDSQPEG
jgi:hypothetical protein